MNVYPSPIVWLRRHWRLAIVLTLIIVPVVVPSARYGFYAMTHSNTINCGSLRYNWMPETVPRVQRVQAKVMMDFQCFLNAHQHCESAALSEYVQNTETASNTTYRTANSLGKCSFSVIEYLDGCIPSFRLYCQLVPTIDSECRASVLEQDGLHFLDCGNIRDLSLLTSEMSF
jgi:hypothetical protein